MQQRNINRQVPEIIRRNVRQAVQMIVQKGYGCEQVLINQYLDGLKAQYQFLLPKSKYYRYYTQELALKMNEDRQRKVPTLIKKQSHPQNIFIVGTVEEVSVGAMCQLIKDLKQNKQPYEPYESQVYEQQITIDLKNEKIIKKMSPILLMIDSLTTTKKSEVKIDSTQKIHIPSKMQMFKSEFGTEKDGSLGTWGGKKYEGLGMRDEFTNYRKKASKSFYHSNQR